MLRDLLFLLARTGSGSALADEARRLYRLAGTVPSDFETPRYGLVDARALRQAREATALAKAAWEKYVRGSAKDLPAFAVAAQQLHAAVARLPWPGLQRLAGSMGMLRPAAPSPRCCRWRSRLRCCSWSRRSIAAPAASRSMIAGPPRWPSASTA
jgi:hypothetical protein